jgi:hypothetical protein
MCSTSMGPGRYDVVHAAASGAVAGLLAGAVLSAAMTAFAVTHGGDAWQSSKIAALPFLGADRVMDPGYDPGAVLVGMTAHYAISAAWGALFGALFYGFGKPATIGLGFAYGLIVWAVMHHVVLPLVRARDLVAALPLPVAIVQHVAFGALIALAFLPFQHSLKPWRFTPATRPG